MRVTILKHRLPARRLAAPAVLLAALLLYGQVIGAAHAANLAPHLDARPCELCIALGGGQAVEPPSGLALASAPTRPAPATALVDVIPKRHPNPVFRSRAPPTPAI